MKRVRPGIQPTVEIVVRRCVMPRSGSRRAAAMHVVEVDERLAHPHEDAVVDRLEPPEMERLVEDLRRCQVAAELHRPGGAERAGERATRLRRDADRASSVAVAHQHRLDRVAVVRAEERLDGAVARLLLPGHGEGRERDAVGKRIAEHGGHVRHRVVAGDAPRSPLPDLARAVGGLAAVAHRRLEQSDVHRVSVGTDSGAFAREVGSHRVARPVHNGRP